MASGAEIPVVVCSPTSMLTQNAVSNREVFRETIKGISSSSSRSGVIARQIDTMMGHEIDCFWSDRAGGDGEIALILRVLVVHNDHHFALPDSSNGVLYRRKWAWDRN